MISTNLSRAGDRRGRVARIVIAGTRARPRAKPGRRCSSGQAAVGHHRRRPVGIRGRAPRTRDACRGADRRAASAAWPALNQCCGGAVTLVTEVLDCWPLMHRRRERYPRRIRAPGRGQRRSAMRETLIGATPRRTPRAGDPGSWLADRTAFGDRASRSISMAQGMSGGAGTCSAPMPEFEVFLVDPREDLSRVARRISSYPARRPKDVMARPRRTPRTTS